jgi:hypothetical protein
VNSSGWEGFAALRMLYLMRLRARVRTFIASLKQPKRLIVLVLIVGLLALVVIGQSHDGATGGSFTGATAQRMIALLFTFFFVTTIVTALSNGVLAFTPAEMQLLFPAPIGTRALLSGHLLASVFKSLSASVVFSLFLRPWDTPFIQAVASYLALFLTLVLIGLTVDLSVIGLPRSRRKRISRLVASGVAIAAALVVGWQYVMADSVFSPKMLDPLGWPVRPWTDLFVARSADVYVGSLAVCLTISAVLAVRPLTYRGDIRESATHSSELVQKALKRMAKGNVGQDRPRTTGGRTLPMLPRWGGAGAHAWRQLSSLSRRRRSYMLLLVFTLFTGIGVGISSFNEMPALMAGAMVAILCFAGPLYVQCDFRSDYDSLAYLRSLPTPPSAMAAGQVLASVLVIYAFQLLMGTWVFAVIPPSQRPVWVFTFLTLPLLNALQLCIENGAFLFYPYRIDYTRGPPGAMQIARMYALMLVKMIVLLLSVACIGLPVWLIAFKAGMLVLAAIVGWLLLAFEVVMSVWLVGRIFTRIDPSRDLPD